MGVTVHFEGRLKDADAFARLVNLVKQIATEETLLTEIIEKQQVKLLRVREEEPRDYFRPTKGIVLYLPEDCEPVRLEFDRNLYIQEWVKTQFAGSRIHIRLICLLRDLQGFFETLNVHDEGEYWDTGSETLLAEHIHQCHDAIAQVSE